VFRLRLNEANLDGLLRESLERSHVSTRRLNEERALTVAFQRKQRYRLSSTNYYIRASGISDQKQKRAILLHLAGAEIQEIFETLPDTGDDYKTALEKLNEHFNPCKNIAFERHVFRQATQRADESMDAFVTRLRTLAKTCQFDTSLDEMIRDQVIEKCASNALRRRLLREQELTLNNLLSIARSFELADCQALESNKKIFNNHGLEQSDDDSSENECLFTLTAHNVHHRSDSLHMLEIEHIPVQMLIDSGASVNVLDLETYHRLKARKGVQLMPSTLRVYAYGSTTPLNIMGTVRPFVFTHTENSPITSRKFPSTPTSNLLVSPHVEFPSTQAKQISAKLEELERLHIIETVRGPTPWVSPLVIVPKSSCEIRVCVDMRQVNTAVIRERYPIPTVEESLQDLNGAAVFSKLDLKWGYHQIELDEKSRELTTFTTHDGLYRYKRLMFGISAAPEIYQHAIQQVLHGLLGNGDFFGFDISARGIRPNAQSVEAICNAPAPTNASEVRSFLGLASFCRRFIPAFSTIAYPLSELTRKAVPWQWTNTHQSSFDKLRKMLTRDCVMAHYDPAAPTQLRVDASPVELSTAAAVIINRMKYNGPQFVAIDLYLREHGITHRRVTPYWPQANSEVERFNRTLEKAIRAANTEGKDWKSELNTFLLNYRATAHCTTGKSPAVLLFGREIRTKLPSLNTSQRDRCQKAKMKKYADEKRRAAPSNIKRGDKVLLKQERKNKLSTKNEPDPYIVVGTKGTSLLLKRRAEPEIMRNSPEDHFRQILHLSTRIIMLDHWHQMENRNYGYGGNQPFVQCVLRNEYIAIVQAFFHSEGMVPDSHTAQMSRGFSDNILDITPEIFPIYLS
ncbi:Transposon Ty3-I Gag-Pol poly, partial [Paramuricea clavata]